MTTQTTTYLDAIVGMPAGATLILSEVTWPEYEALADELAAERPGFRLFYDQGELVIMSPSSLHELYTTLIVGVFFFYRREKRIRAECRGATTFKRKPTRQGAEPDTCFYVRNVDRIIGKQDIDLTTDPPPDVVVEIDVKHRSTEKFAFYASLGVIEIWRYDQRGLRMFRLQDDRYVEIATSDVLVGLSAGLLTRLLEQGRTEGQAAALDAFVDWLHEPRDPSAYTSS